MAPRVLLWHRTDLRLHDAPALQAALDLKPEAFFPTWTWNRTSWQLVRCLTPTAHYVHRQAVGPNRFQFLLDSMQALSEAYAAVNAKQKLHVLRGPPETILPMLFKRWKITHLVYEYDPDPYACDRDEEATKLAEEAGVEVIVKHGFTLYDPRKIIEKNKGKAPIAYGASANQPSRRLRCTGPFCKLIASIGDPAKPIDAPTELPDPGDTSLDEPDRADHDVGPYRERDVNHVSRKGDDHGFDTVLGPDGDFSVPTCVCAGQPVLSEQHGRAEPGGGDVDDSRRREARARGSRGVSQGQEEGHQLREAEDQPRCAASRVLRLTS